MKKGNIVTIIDKIFFWIYNLALLNLCWIMFSIRGLLVGGVFPSLVASLGVARKILFGEKDISITKLFKSIYLREFKDANKAGWLLTFVGLILYFNFTLIQNANNNLSIIIPISFYTILVIYFTVCIWVFPLMTHHFNSIKQQFLNALIIGVKNIHITFMVWIFIFAFLYISLTFPSFLLFFTISGTSFFWIYFTLKKIKKSDNNLLDNTSLIQAEE